MTNPGGNEPDQNAESQVLREILQWLAREHPDYLTWRNNVGAHHGVDTGTFVRFGLVGSSDIICVVPPNGRFVGIECKRRNGGVQSKEQKAFQRALERVGGVYVLARSVEDVRKVIG